MTTIALLPGDGIGSEILDGLVALPAAARARGPAGSDQRAMALRHHRVAADWGDAAGTNLEACGEADVVPSGAVGTHPGVSPDDCSKPESAVIALRIVLAPMPCRRSSASQRDVRASGPGRRTISVDKASVYTAWRLWRRLTRCTAACRDVKFESVNVDRAAYELVTYEDLPAVIVTEGQIGDILSKSSAPASARQRCAGSATINPDPGFSRASSDRDYLAPPPADAPGLREAIASRIGTVLKALD